MSYLRYNIQLAIKEPVSGSIKKITKDFEKLVEDVRKYTVRINDGQGNEEETVKATWHICRHDEGKPCDDEIEIGVDPHPKRGK